MANPENPMVRSPEDRLIQHCAKNNLSAEESDAARELLAGERDWPYIVAKGSRHGVAPSR